MGEYQVPVIRAGKVASSAATVEIRGVDGAPLAEVATAPPLLAKLTAAEVRTATTHEAASARLLRRTGELFAAAELDGLTPERYCELQARSSGVPVSVARRSLHQIAQACAQMGDRVAAQRPAGAAERVAPGEIKPVWVRRGDVLSVVAPSNNPGVHVQWLEGLAFGYRLLVRPGSTDPFTPARLMFGLLEAGVDPSSVSLLPGGHATADALIEAADLSLVFGGDAAIQRYAGNRRVIPRGPGRSKLLHTGPICAEALDIICDSVGYDAGLRCTNASAVFTEADPRELGEAVAERLAKLVAAPPLSPMAELPVLPAESARKLRDHLESRRAGGVDVAARHYPEGVIADLGDSSAALRPAVLVCDRSDHPGSAVELPFPCVWILPWHRDEGLAPLGDTLALTILSDDAALASAAVRHPRIRKVLFGPLPTYSAGPTNPHDGFLGHELMEARAYGVAGPVGSRPNSSMYAMA